MRWHFRLKTSDLHPLKKTDLLSSFGVICPVQTGRPWCFPTLGRCRSDHASGSSRHGLRRALETGADDFGAAGWGAGLEELDVKAPLFGMRHGRCLANRVLLYWYLQLSCRMYHLDGAGFAHERF